jgi:hypothetical protein
MTSLQGPNHFNPSQVSKIASQAVNAKKPEAQAQQSEVNFGAQHVHHTHTGGTDALAALNAAQLVKHTPSLDPSTLAGMPLAYNLAEAGVPYTLIEGIIG